MNEYSKRETAINATKDKIGKGNLKLGQKLDKLALALEKLEKRG